MSSLTIAERRVNELQAALTVAVRTSRKLTRIQRELEETRSALEQAAEAIYNATLYDPEGEREDY